MVLDGSQGSYDAARHRAAAIDRSDRGRIVVSGPDRASYLHGLLTNDIAALATGRGCYAAYLTAQGRMIADLYVYELGDVILVTTDGAVKDTLLAKLDQFIFSENVQLGDVTESYAQVAVVGPRAPEVLSRILSGVSPEALRGLPEHGNLRTEWNAELTIVTAITDTGEPGFDVFVEQRHRDALLTAIGAAGAEPLDAAAADAIRIEAGVPLFNRDMDQETIPLEAGIESRAISFTKGCYVGQEVIVRVLHRGHGRVVRKLVGLSFTGAAPPAAKAAIRAGDRAVGQVTSGTFSPALQRPIALGYVHRDFVEPGTAVTVDGIAAEVTALPFVGREQAVE
jgi:folate-binding protein YgfZ